jgi:hypothetical protein
MSRESTCRCLICGLERYLTLQLSESYFQERYREFACSHSLLSVFPLAADLITYLHASRSISDGTHSADGILAALLRAHATGGHAPALRDLLLLAFIPTLHSTSRQVAARCPSLSADDIAQHVVASLLQILASPEFYSRSSHVAFAISRILKRNAFEWAERECRSVACGASPETFSDALPAHNTAEPAEHVVFLQHFLYRCQQRGFLTDEELELLVQFKLEDASAAALGNSAAVYSNASRQRMKRLLGKLRRVARTPRTRKQDDDQLRLF